MVSTCFRANVAVPVHSTASSLGAPLITTLHRGEGDGIVRCLGRVCGAAGMQGAHAAAAWNSSWDRSRLHPCAGEPAPRTRHP